MQLSPISESFGQDDQSWLGSAHGTDATRSITLDRSTFTAGTHFPNGYFLSGIGLGKITSTGKYGPYNNASSDGTETLVGFLFCAVGAGTTDVDPVAAILRHGVVIQSKLPVSLGDSTAIAAAKVDVAGRIDFV